MVGLEANLSVCGTILCIESMGRKEKLMNWVLM
jgi:hypothetical protein